MKEGRYRFIKHMVGHEAKRSGYHVYVLIEDRFYNFYLPKGLPQKRSDSRLVLDVSSCCSPEVFYDLEYKEGKLLEEGEAEMELDGRGIKLSLGGAEYRFIPREKDRYLCLLRATNRRRR
ncbi:MAG: hypothetical protein ACE5PM_04345 [Candidatus Hydrothermarchaeales archaeon]